MCAAAIRYEFLREKVLLKEQDGTFALWKGVVAGMSAGALGFFEQCCRDSLVLLYPSAGIIGQAIASPTDLVKVQMQADGKRIMAGQPRRYWYSLLEIDW